MKNTKVTREQAELAVKNILHYIGENPEREGLIDTPARVVDAMGEFFSGYSVNPEDVLAKTFQDVEDFKEIVLVRDIRLESHCEHHMAPMIGIAHVAYVPDAKIVGLSKIARLVEVYSKRLQTQERMTKEIASSLEACLNPLGVAVIIKAKHQCMTMRGVHKPTSSTVTAQWIGCFEEEKWQNKLHSLLAVEN